MPWLLYRYIIRDLLRVLGLTAGVLVTVIAFGATIKPLANDTLLDAAQTAKYMALAIVPMLQFALPFSAGFAATITMHRMTNDNEILAMSAGGISYRRIMVPLIGMGLALTLFMVVLTQWIIPQFWVLIEQTIATDITKLFRASIEKGEPFKVGNLQIYADQVIVEDHPADTQADTRMRLWRVAAAELDRDGRIITDVTANQAVVDVYRREGRTYLKLVLTETVAFKPDAGQLARNRLIDPKRAIMVPSPSHEQPKALTRSQLLRLRTSPEDYRPVREARESLIEGLRTEHVRQAMRDQLASAGLIRLIDPAAEGRMYEIHAERIDDDQVLRQGKQALEIIQIDGGRPVHRIIAQTVNLIQSGGTALQELAFDLEMVDCRVSDLIAAESAANDRSVLKAPGLVFADSPSADLSNLASSELIAMAMPMTPHSNQIEQKVNRLNQKTARLMREISARLMNRYALSVTAMMLLVLGATLAMWMRGSLPLTIYLWAFVPSILDLILISAGEQMMRNGRVFAPYLMWSGNGLMLVAWMLAYFKMSRN